MLANRHWEPLDMTEITEKMAEKIEWYQEVLELEPNSKVFFRWRVCLWRLPDRKKRPLYWSVGLSDTVSFWKPGFF